MNTYRLVAFLDGGRTRLVPILADTHAEAWGLATRLARRLGAVGFEVAEIV